MTQSRSRLRRDNSTFHHSFCGLTFLPSAFRATNRWGTFIASTHNNAWYDRSTNFVELEVNVPRTIGILRDDYVTRLKRLSTKVFDQKAASWQPTKKVLRLQNHALMRRHLPWHCNKAKVNFINFNFGRFRITPATNLFLYLITCCQKKTQRVVKWGYGCLSKRTWHFRLQ